MNLSESPTIALSEPMAFELRFELLANPGRAVVFPCNECGAVDMDAMSQRARNNYFRARALRGLDYAYPMVCRVGHACVHFPCESAIAEAGDRQSMHPH